MFILVLLISMLEDFLLRVWLNQSIPRPYIIFYLHLPFAAIIERLQKRNDLTFLSEIDEWFIVIDGISSVSLIHNKTRYYIDKFCFNEK